MPRSGGIILIAVAGLLVTATRPAAAYDHKHTHRWLTRMAAEYLVAAYPGQYDELLEYVDRAAAGAEHEDDLFLDGDDDPQTLRVMRHFYRPADGRGLTMNGQTFPSSFEWATGDRADNEWDWDDGIAAYAAGDKEQAYYVLGHMVHLIQDLTVPAHTHLDIHGPPSGDDYEGYCSRQMLDEYHSNLPLPPAGSPIPEFANPYEAWRKTSLASYWRSLYPGVLSGTDQASGAISEMFPAISWSWFSENWTISEPPVGALNEDFFEDEPGYYYFKNSEYPAAVDRAAFDPTDPLSFDFEANPGDASMTELMARDLVPIAVLHSAGVMKLYIDQARAAAPTSDPNDPADPDESAPGGCGIAAPSGGAPSAPFALLALVVAVALAPRRFR